MSNKINYIEIEGNKINCIKVYLTSEERLFIKFKKSKGYEASVFDKNLDEFYTEDAIKTFLASIGLANMSLELNTLEYKQYIKLSKYVTDDIKIIIDGHIFLNLFNNNHLVETITLNENNNIDRVIFKNESSYTNANNYNNTYDISYINYMFISAISRNVISESDLEENLKKYSLALNPDGSIYNYYSYMENESKKIIREIRTNDGSILTGIFLVDISNSLLNFTVIEDSFNNTYKKELPRNLKFYISSTNIAYMQ